MTTVAFDTPTPTASVTEAMFQAENKAANMLAVYIIGCGVSVAALLLTWSYGESLAHVLQLPSLAALTLAVLWISVGGGLMYRQSREVKNCTARYDAHIERQMQARMARDGVSHAGMPAHWPGLPRFTPEPTVTRKRNRNVQAQAAARTTEKLVALCMPARLPASIFGAYL